MNNLYIVLRGPAGSGKTTARKIIEQALKDSKKFNIKMAKDEVPDDPNYNIWGNLQSQLIVEMKKGKQS